jgi:hypothetical protein
MKQIAFSCVVTLVCAVVFAGCNDNQASKQVTMEEVKAYKPNLPSVPTIPRPSVEEMYSDGSYSIYGMRKAINKTIETQLTVTAYVVKIYERPVCAEGQTCNTLMPHLFLADQPDEKIERRLLRLVGYANNFQEMDEQKERDEKGEKEEPLPDGTLRPPIIWNWQLGHKYKVSGRFTRQSGAGFMDTDGVLEYELHQCMDCPPEEEKPAKK